MEKSYNCSCEGWDEEREKNSWLWRRHIHLHKSWGNKYAERKLFLATQGSIIMIILAIVVSLSLFVFKNYFSAIIFMLFVIFGIITFTFYLLPLGLTSNIE